MMIKTQERMKRMQIAQMVAMSRYAWAKKQPF